MVQIELQLRSGSTERVCVWTFDGGAAPAEGAEADAEGFGVATRLRLDRESQGVYRLEVRADGAWTEDVVARLRVPLPASGLERVAWPTYHGAYERYSLERPRSATFRGAGASALALDSSARLSLPMAVVSGRDGDAAWMAGSDPSFTTDVTIERGEGGAGAVTFAWKWLAAAGAHRSETRRLFVLPTKDERSALDEWFLAATPDVPAGPAWLHDIALTDYDFLSKNGEGWFADIDAACEWIPPEERHRAIFCLHGWYDEVGSYCFDPDTGDFKDRWTAFPYVNHPEVAALSTDAPRVQDIPGLYAYAFRNLERYAPVEMSWEGIRRRLAYAKSRGFRTAFYAMTGLQVAGKKEARLEDGSALELDFPLWVGPELLGESYLLNPLHPDVRSFFKRYIAKLIERVGDLTDAFVMDEAYYVPYGALGPAACPGYADRAQLTLVKELADLCHRSRPTLAFLTADNLGLSRLEKRAFPYSFYADGLFTDVMCWPMSWDCFRFPLWRNAAWSCNWAPYSNLNFTRWGVLAHHGNVSWSNGCFGDDMGLAELDDATKEEVMELWRARTRRAKEREVRIVEVRER